MKENTDLKSEKFCTKVKFFERRIKEGKKLLEGGKKVSLFQCIIILCRINAVFI